MKAKYLGSSAGLTALYENPAEPAKGMIAYITNACNSGIQIGDSRGAWLADTVAETITASGELVTNGTFPTNIAGWTDSSSAGGAIAWNASGAMDLVNTTGNAVGSQSETTLVGRTYMVVATKGGTTLALNVGTTATGSTLYAGAVNATDVLASFVATTTTSFISAVRSTTGTGTIDNISVKLAEPDRSVKNNGLIVVGSLTKSAVATGANLMAYSGFSGSNYLEQAYSANLDFGTGDFCIMGWVSSSAPASSQKVLFERKNAAGTVQLAIVLQSSGSFTVYVANASTDFVSTAVTLAPNIYTHVLAVRASGVLSVYINGVFSVSVATTRNLTFGDGVLRVGCRDNNTLPAANESLALWRISASAPSTDQIAHIYRTELPLFQANAKCTIDGSSTAVTALAYDDTTDLLQVGTSWGRTNFKNLVRVDSEATTTGALTSLSANQGAILTGGTSAKYYQPALLLRDELRRKDEARKALGKVPVFFEFDAVTSQVAFVLPKGYTCKAVYSAGTLKRVGSTKDYLVSDDSFQETVTFAAAPGNGVWVSVMAVRK